MKIPSLTFKDQIAYVKPVWRVLLLITVVQLTGGFLSILAGGRSDPFFDFWYGGVYATSLGFFLGVIWQHLALPGSLRKNFIVLSIFAGASVILFLCAYFGTIF